MFVVEIACSIIIFALCMSAPQIKYITIDARDNVDFLPYSEFFTEFPNKIGHVTSFSIASVELPIAFIIDPSNDICGPPRYVYLEVIENREHSCENGYLFTSSIICSRNSKYVIARITLDYKNYPEGSILPANLVNGLLISGTRKYHKPSHLCNLRFRLLNELGLPIFLKNERISFCAQVECSRNE
jgi:hypothetical protein